MKLSPIKLYLIFFLGCIVSEVFAQGAAGVLATVNGVKITSAQLDQFVTLANLQGRPDTPELRQAFLRDLIVREAIAQDVKKTGLLSRGSNALKIKIAEQDAIMGLWFSQYFAEHPISESEVRAEYEKQIAISRDPKNVTEYQISQIVVATESEGNEIIAKVNSGASFETLAREKSLDKTSGQNGGLVGWVLPTQLAPPMNEFVTTLTKGKVTLHPVQVGSVWFVIKVDDLKPFVLPSFDQAKVSISQAMLQKERREAIQSLMQGVKVVQGK